LKSAVLPPTSAARSKPAGQFGGGVPSSRGTTALDFVAVVRVARARGANRLHSREP